MRTRFLPSFSLSLFRYGFPFQLHHHSLLNYILTPTHEACSHLTTSSPSSFSSLPSRWPPPPPPAPAPADAEMAPRCSASCSACRRRRCARSAPATSTPSSTSTCRSPRTGARPRPHWRGCRRRRATWRPSSRGTSRPRGPTSSRPTRGISRRSRRGSCRGWRTARRGRGRWRCTRCGRTWRGGWRRASPRGRSATRCCRFPGGPSCPGRGSGRGLLVSKMYDTAKEIVLNLVYLVEKYGFVPNGSRTYYTNRSQPPLLSSMVLDVYKATGDLGFVRKAFPSLLKEHSFWMSDVHNVEIQDHQGRVHNLSRYQAMWNKPRPESATIDEELASKLSSTSDKEKFYHQVASTAESGWDFSSRWMSNSSDLTTLSTTSIIPVDLNTFMCKMERDISFFAKLIGDNITSEMFLEASKARQTAIDSVFWNSEMDQWLDYWVSTDGSCEGVYQWKANSQNRNIFASNFIPLWLNAHHSGLASFVDEIKSVRVMRSLQRSGLLHAAGIATSLSNTGQQWDFPNGWAPLQHLIVEGLVNCGTVEARSFAEDISTRWVRTNSAAYKTTGAMHEKYDVEACGDFGGGGEYKPQTGFGWSNGVILAFLEEFGWPQDKQLGCL